MAIALLNVREGLNDSMVPHHGDGVGGQQFPGAHSGDVSDVGGDVRKRHQGDGDKDRPGQVSRWGRTR